MKKELKITFLVVAVLTVLLIAAAIVMVRAVSGDALFYMNSQLGNIYAVSYRFVCLASALLILFWVVLGVRKRASIFECLSRFKRKPKEITPPASAPVYSQVPDPTPIPASFPTPVPASGPAPSSASVQTAAPTVPAERKTVVCVKCGKPRPSDKPFCPHCGEPANLE